MKLFSKITVLYIFVILIVFGIGGLVTYNKVKIAVKMETDYSIREEARFVVQGINDGKPIDALRNDKVLIHEISMDIEENKRGSITDTLMLHRSYARIENFRKLQSSHKINGNHYALTITDVFIEQGDLLDGVVRTMSRLFIFLSFMFVLFSYLISKRLLAPFEEALSRIKDFSIRNKHAPTFPGTSTKEFIELNLFLGDMTEKARSDYVSLKEFSENASHEIQTPLAIATGKLELLQESQNLGEEELKLINTCQNSLIKLSKLGQSLALITKIENQEYSKIGPLEFTNVVNSTVDSFLDLAELKNLKFSKELRGDVIINLDESLAEILVGNLIKNAVQHNVQSGWIHVELDSEHLQVRNSGLDPKIATERLFERFRKSNQSGGSLGLGLSIVKQICDLNRFALDYHYKEDVHTVDIRFGQ